MNPTTESPDALEEYVANVGQLKEKLLRVTAGQQALAENLARAAAALRSIGQGRTPA